MSQRLSRGALWVLVPALLFASGAHAADGLAFLQILRNGTGGVDGLKGARGIAVSADGTSLYATGNEDAAVAVFRRDPASGELAFIGRERNDVDGVQGLDRAYGVAVSPDGGRVYVTGTRDDAVVVFRRNPANGKLTFVERQLDGVADVTDLDGPAGIAMSPDGLHLYVAATNGSAIVVFARDPRTDGLRFIEARRNSEPGVSGLAGAEGLAISPDGTTVYVASPVDKTVAVFGRDAETGRLTFVERQRDNTDGVDGLDGARGLAVSPDGQHVYVAGKLDKALAVFTRASDGRLTYVTRYRDTLDGVEGLDGVEAVAVSPDGTLVYTAAFDDNAVAVFRRDAATGRLTFLGRQQSGSGTIDGLAGPHALAVSADGGQVYVAAQDTSALLVFGTRCGDGRIDAVEQCDDGNGTGGDGCSAGCRVECQVAADCEDGDSCTEARCRGGECIRPRCGFTGAICELDDGGPGLERLPQCTGRSARRLGRAIRQRLKEARHELRLAQRQPNASGKTVNKHVSTLLTTMETKAQKLEKRKAISVACYGSLTDAVDALKQVLGQIVQRKGLCSA